MDGTRTSAYFVVEIRKNCTYFDGFWIIGIMVDMEIFSFETYLTDILNKLERKSVIIPPRTPPPSRKPNVWRPSFGNLMKSITHKMIVDS